MHKRLHSRRHGMAPLAAGLAVLWLLLCLVAEPKARGQVRDDLLAVIVHPGVSVHALSAYELEAIFTLSQREWSGGGHILVFNPAPGSPTRVRFDRTVLRMEPDQVGRFWIDKRVRGAGLPPRVVSSSAVAVRIVAGLAGSISYVPRADVTPDVKVVAWVDDRRVLAP